MYPSIAMAMNISRMTRYATVLHVDSCPHTLEEISEIYEAMKKERDSSKKKKLSNEYKKITLENTHYIDELFDKLATPEEDCVDVCQQVFNLPNFTQMKSLFENRQ